MVGFDSVVGFSTNSESVAGYDSASLASSALGTLDGSESVHSTTKECFQPTTLQSAEGNFQHYARCSHNMYTVHGDTPAGRTLNTP